MKYAFLPLVLALSAPAFASEKFFASEVVTAKQVSGGTEGIPASPSHEFWKGIGGKIFPIYPQKSVRLNDKTVNAALETLAPSSIEARVAASEKELGIWVEWTDSTKTLFNRSETNSFGDSVAIEIPVAFGEGKRLPYIGMGDEKFPVRVAMQRAAEEGVLSSEYVAAGFGSLTRLKSALKMKMAMEYDAGSQKWRAVFVRPLVDGSHSVAQGLVPVAFAVWDGARSERGGNKYLSSWKFASLPAHKPSPAYVKAMSYGYNPGDLGDIAKGKQVVTTTCIGCHRVGGVKAALEGMAPDLSNIGGISTYGYLRDSVTQPHEVVIRNLNANRHYNKGGTPDKFRAYPNNELYKWYTADGKGSAKSDPKKSKMPPFGFLSAQDVSAVVNYLKSLDGTEAKGNTP